MTESALIRLEWWVIQHLRGCFRNASRFLQMLDEVDANSIDPFVVMTHVFAEGHHWGRYLVFAWWLCNTYGYKKGREHWVKCKRSHPTFNRGIRA